jgi:hypothetical protein
VLFFIILENIDKIRNIDEKIGTNLIGKKLTKVNAKKKEKPTTTDGRAIDVEFLILTSLKT